MILDSNFLEFIECLNKNNVEYILVGGYAVVLNGVNRTTQDLDIFIRRTDENADKVLKAIDDFGFGSIGFTKADLQDKQGIVQIGRPPLRIDILCELPGVDFETAYNEANDYEEEGVRIKVMHINQLITNKLAVARDKDLADAKALQKILKRK